MTQTAPKPPPVWQDLQRDYDRLQNVSTAALYKSDKLRDQNFTITLPDGISLYYGRNRIDQSALNNLLALAEATGVADKAAAMASGQPINRAENRAVMHMALRAPASAQFAVNGTNVMPDVLSMRDRLRAFCQKIHEDGLITDILHIGIGGSELGPRMACKALTAYARPNMKVHFAGNADGAILADLLPTLNAKRTLVLIASKTFTTDETMTNARIVRQWLIDHVGEAKLPDHLVALSSNRGATEAFGLHPDRVFPFADWVGGRFSLWSSIGLPVALLCGYDVFAKLLDGAADMDAHFLNAPIAQNMPVMHALVAIWNRCLGRSGAYAILPYAEYLRDLPAYMQQLVMESNGKSVTQDGQAVSMPTAPVIFGTCGTDCQHSFMQMIHQGCDDIPCDLIGVLQVSHAYDALHRKLLANMLAQSRALLTGRQHDDPRQNMRGSRPHNLVFLPQLDSYCLGQLLAMYEHSTAVQGFVWDINSFDQPGVELGKVIAKSLEDQIPHHPLSIQDIDTLLSGAID